MIFFRTTTVYCQKETAAIHQLKKLSIEELLDIEVTSVSRSPQKLTEVASAIQVITNEDIHRSGATSIPEALRLASNLQVAQLNSSAWIISARGFNTVFANKLLVLIDGRTVYTPLFGGVIWELQSVFLEDVDRIEVISGPGGTLWGANAVNGVINIITKKAKDTQGLYASVGTGTFLRKFGSLRYGGKIGDKLFYRLYTQYHHRDNTFLPEGGDNKDAWRNTQAGFRMGWYPTKKDFITFQGDFNLGQKKTDPTESPFDGQNILGRWTRTISEKSEYVLQLYFDRYWREDHVGIADELKTYDLDFQHRFPLHKRHSLLWGLGYRFVNDQVENRTAIGLDPEQREMPIYSGFFQDEITVHENLLFTIGTKLLHNVFSGFEIQPSARLAWTARQHTLWAAVSRAIRAPSRLDVDYYLPIERQPPNIPSVAGGPNFDSEKLLAFELGYRVQPNTNSSFSLATFYNDYNNVYSVEPLPETLTYQIQNGSEAETWGAEFSGFYQVTDAWRLKGGFTYFAKDLRAKPGRTHDPSYLANDAKHHLVIQSMLDMPFNFRFDFVARYLDYLPATFATARVPEYFTGDVRLAWEYKQLEISLTGQNLWSSEHAEFGSIDIPRSIYGKVACRF